jgi:AmmeMemoRadiSam system protein A
MTKEISPVERKFLLKTARQAIKKTLKGEPLPEISLDDVSPLLREPGACFITLTIGDQLRGCVGSIEATKPLILDVRNRAIGAAFEDPRFPSLTDVETKDLEIEISILTKPEPLFYDSPDDLITKLQIGIDGVILKDRSRRATFLPQVWMKLPEPALFLSRLCLKLGLASDTWQSERLDVETYQVVKISEEETRGR